MITARSVYSYSKLYSIVVCVFIAVATVLEFVIGQNPTFLASDCYQALSNYITSISIFNVVACILPLISMCCTKYILFTNAMICICGLFFFRSVWTFGIFTKYFNTEYKYINRECYTSNIFYDQLGVINIEMLLAVINILLIVSMIVFLLCTKIYVTQKNHLDKSYVTSHRTKYGEIKTDTYVDTEDASMYNIAVVRTSDMDRILCFVIGTCMILIGTHHALCYTYDNVLENTSFYNDTLVDLEKYALFSTAVNYMCGILLLILTANRENICAEKIPGALCVVYVMCMVCGIIVNNTIKNIFETHTNKSETNLAYDIYSVAQFDSMMAYIMIIVPLVFANFSSIYIIDMEKKPHDNILTARLLSNKSVANLSAII